MILPEVPAVDPEQVMLDPAVFSEMRHALKFKPSADMFAWATHHQLPRFYSKSAVDPASAGVDAFEFDWKCEGARILIPTVSDSCDVAQNCVRPGAWNGGFASLAICHVVALVSCDV